MPHICLSGLATQENLKDLSFCKRSKLQIILFIMRISFVKIISSVISVVSIGCFNAQAANWNTDSFDYSNLKVIEVPSGFPERSQEVSLRCNADNGNSWTFRLQAFYSNDFFWAYDHGRNNRTLFVGKRTSSDKFVIRSSQARSKKRDQPDYLTISINSPNLHEALLSGKFGGQRGGNNWWEKCLISTDRFSKALSTSRRYGQLKSAIARQKFGLPAMAEFGIAAKQKYNFEALRDALEPEYIAILEERKAKRAAEMAARKKLKEKRAAALAAKKKAEEEAKRAAELAAKKKAEEEAKRAAELAAKKKAKEEVSPEAKLAAKKKAEEEAKRAAELAAKKKAEEETKRAAELAAKKKADEETKRAAELAAKKKAEEEAKRVALKKAISEAQKEAAQLYGFAIQYVKDGLASDVVAWSKDYSAAPKLDNKWGEEELTGYNSFKSKVFANQAFKNYVDEKKSTVQDQIRQQKKNTLSALAAAKDKLEPLIIERFGEDSAEGISRLIEKINFELEKNLDNETLEQKNLDSLLQSASRLIEDDQRVKNIAEALSSLSSKIEALDLTEMTADLAKKAQDLSSQLSEVKNMGVAELETFSKRAEFIVKSLDEQLAKNQARAAKKAKDLADKKFKELNQTAESLDLDLFSQRWRKSNREVLREEWVNKYVKISVVLMNIIKAEEESVILVYESATPSLFASNSVSITIKKSGTWPSANPKQFESLKNEILTGKWRSRKGKKGTVYGVINEIDERGTIVLDGDQTFFY
jgi:hypothetical protein